MVSHLLWALGKMSRWTSKLLDAQNGQPLQDLVFRQAVICRVTGQAGRVIDPDPRVEHNRALPGQGILRPGEGRQQPED